MFSTANAALWAESTAALEEDVSEDAYRLVRKPAKKGSEAGGGRGERGKREVLGHRRFRFEDVKSSNDSCLHFFNPVPQ